MSGPRKDETAIRPWRIGKRVHSSCFSRLMGWPTSPNIPSIPPRTKRARWTSTFLASSIASARPLSLQGQPPKCRRDDLRASTFWFVSILGPLLPVSNLINFGSYPNAPKSKQIELGTFLVSILVKLRTLFGILVFLFYISQIPEKCCFAIRISDILVFIFHILSFWNYFFIIWYVFGSHF